MASEVGLAVIRIFSLVLTFIFFGWILYMVYWLFKKLGFFRWLDYRKLKRKFPNYEFDDEILDFVRQMIKNKWRYEDVKRVTKHELKRDEILYTYILARKLKGGQ